MERRHPRLCVVGLVVFSLLPIGCSRSAPQQTTQAAKPAVAAAAQDPAPAATVDACSLLTVEEVGAAIGKPVTPVTESTGQAASCAYRDAKNQADKCLGLVVYSVTPSEAKGAFEATRGGGRDQVAVPGVGDDAYWDKTFGLYVLKGRYEIDLIVTEAHVDGLQVARTLAQKVLSRLP